MKVVSHDILIDKAIISVSMSLAVVISLPKCQKRKLSFKRR